MLHDQILCTAAAPPLLLKNSWSSVKFLRINPGLSPACSQSGQGIFHPHVTSAAFFAAGRRSRSGSHPRQCSAICRFTCGPPDARPPWHPAGTAPRPDPWSFCHGGKALLGHKLRLPFSPVHRAGPPQRLRQIFQELFSKYCTAAPSPCVQLNCPGYIPDDLLT